MVKVEREREIEIERTGTGWTCSFVEGGGLVGSRAVRPSKVK